MRIKTSKRSKIRIDDQARRVKKQIGSQPRDHGDDEESVMGHILGAGGASAKKDTPTE
jgi:hypothetical protein